jgi:hypothetical protein
MYRPPSDDSDADLDLRLRKSGELPRDDGGVRDGVRDSIRCRFAPGSEPVSDRPSSCSFSAPASASSS